MDFSLSLFSRSGAELQGSGYEFLIRSAQFADRHGFTAV
jgi:hypothetical protein